MVKRVFAILFVCAFVSMSILFSACGDPTATASSSSSGSPSSPNQVHMNDADFVQHSITIHKGDSITLVDDVAKVHYIFNGEWDSSGNQKQLKEPGAPVVQLQFQGNDRQQIGPFNTAGSYHFYCSIHPNMNLTVIVQ